MKPINLEHAFRLANHAARRRASIDALAIRLLLEPPGSKIVVSCPTPGDAEALGRDLKAAVARLTKGRI